MAATAIEIGHVRARNVAPRARRVGVLPGFRWTLGYTLVWLGLVVLLPLVAMFARSASMGADAFVAAVTAPRVVAAFQLSFGVALAASAVNAVFGLLLAWVLTRYRFPGRRIVDALVDLPIALPTAVAGIALAALYAPNGWIGRWFTPFDLKLAFTPIGIAIALVFVGLPFVVRTVQPVLEDVEREQEEAALGLGASSAQAFWRITLPTIAPALATGYALAFARALGEYGSVIFIAGNLPMVSEIVPLLIVTKLEQYDYAGATAIATTMLAASFVLLLAINALQAQLARREAP